MPWVSLTEWEEPEWSLGWAVADWIEAYLVVPGGPLYGRPFVLSGWQLRAVADWFAVDARGEWLFRRGQVRLPKGTGKSPWAAAVLAAELAGPCQFDGWDAAGEPVGRPAAAPFLQVAAVSEDQAGNTYGAFHAMLSLSPLLDEAGIDLGVTRTVLRGRPGRLDVVTASAGSREGQPITGAVADETHLWRRTNGGRKLFATLTRNATKMGARVLSTTNAWTPGDESVAEATELAARSTPGIMIVGPQYESVVDDLDDVDALRAGLEHCYRDSPWVGLERVLADCRDPDTAREDVARFFLNHPVAADAALCGDPVESAEPLEVGAPVALGFDGSRTRDATVLVAVHMVTGVAYLLGYWERPLGLSVRERWEVPRGAVCDVVETAFARYEVARMKADPSHWQGELAGWRQRWPEADRFPVWMGSIVDRAVEATQTALGSGACRLSSGEESAVLGAHVRSAVVLRRSSGSGGRVLRLLVKPDDGGRIDAAAALVYAWQARLEAQSSGWAPSVERTRPIVMFG